MTPAPVVQSLPGALLCVCARFSLVRGSELRAFPSQKQLQRSSFVMYDAPSLEDKSADELECFANMVTAVLALPAWPLELTWAISLVSHVNMGSYPQFDITDQIYGSEMRNKAATTARLHSKTHVVTT